MQLPKKSPRHTGFAAGSERVGQNPARWLLALWRAVITLEQLPLFDARAIWQVAVADFAICFFNNVDLAALFHAVDRRWVSQPGWVAGAPAATPSQTSSNHAGSNYHSTMKPHIRNLIVEAWVRVPVYSPS